MSSFLKSSVPLYMIAISTTFAGAAVWIIKDRMNNTAGSETTVSPGSNETAGLPTCKPILERIAGYDYIAPLLLVEGTCESSELFLLKNSLVNIIDQKKAAGVLNTASFYFRDMDKALWTGSNENEKYFPGSLMKVPDLMSYLMMEEQEPGKMNTKIYYSKPFIVLKEPVFISKKLPEGNYYTGNELLRYMITYSDNNATALLSNSFGDKYFNKILADFHLPAVQPNQRNYPLSAREFSMFMRSIYNASYLSFSHSEQAAELLSTCDFKDGFSKGLPEGTKLIHKFGEAGTNDEKQLHESAILYSGGHAYLLTVMTKGKDQLQLAATLSDMMAAVYKYLNN